MIRVFDSHGTDSKLRKYDNSPCVVKRALTEEEVDISDVGRMYRIQFSDGRVADAFEDELR